MIPLMDCVHCPSDLACQRQEWSGHARPARIHAALASQRNDLSEEAQSLGRQ